MNQVELTTCFYEFFNYESTNFFHIMQYLFAFFQMFKTGKKCLFWTIINFTAEKYGWKISYSENSWKHVVSLIQEGAILECGIEHIVSPSLFYINLTDRKYKGCRTVFKDKSYREKLGTSDKFIHYDASMMLSSKYPGSTPPRKVVYLVYISSQLQLIMGASYCYYQ